MKKHSVAGIIFFLFFQTLIAQAQIPVPARIGGPLTIDDIRITHENDAGYVVIVTRDDGASFVPAAEDTDGLNISDWYLIDIPIYDSKAQPDGAVPGDTAAIRIHKDDKELVVISPPDGEFTVGDAGSNTRIDIVAETRTNHPPVADAGSDRTVTPGDTVMLDGSGSSDPDPGDSVTYEWHQSAGTDAPLSDDTDPRPTFVAPSNGTLIFELTVTDNQGVTDTDQVTITIISENQAPVAHAGPDRTVTQGSLVTLDGSNSADPDGNITAYFWEQIGGTETTLSDNTAASPTFTASGMEGESLVFELKVTDNEGLTDSDQVRISIASRNQPPMADAGPDRTVTEGSLVTLDGSNSTDPDGHIIAYHWEQITGTPMTLSDNAAVRVTFTASDGDLAGESLGFELMVTDNLGLQNTDRVTVNITSENQPPMADAGPDRTVNQGELVTLDGSGSYDPDGQIVSYLWRQIRGTVMELSDTEVARPTFTATLSAMKSESLTFELMVTDDLGLQHTDSVTVNVIHTNHPPMANAGPDQTVNEGDIVILDGSGSSDPDDGIASYLWRQTGGPVVRLSDAMEISAMFPGPNVGPGGATLTFELMVTDYQGLRHSDQVMVFILHINEPPVARAGPDQTVNEGDYVTLDGSGSTDPDDGIATYLWTQTSGTSVALSQSEASVSGFAAPDIGVISEALGFALTVTDYQGARSTDSLTVNVIHANQAPVAHAGTDQTVNEGCEVRLDGSGSRDPDDGIASYLWRQTEGPTVTLSDSTAIFPAFVLGIGTETKFLAFELTVTDHGGLKDTDSVTVTVNHINRSPTAHAGSVRTVSKGDKVILDGSGSSDPDGRIVSYLWEQTFGTEVALSDATTVSPTFVAPDAGRTGQALIFRLTVTDDGGLTDTDRVTVNVISENQAPVAHAGADQTVNEGKTVTLDGSGSSDPERGILVYLWEQKEGTNVPTNVPLSDSGAVHPTFIAPEVGPDGGSVLFRLTVTDDGGLTDKDTVTVNIRDAGQWPVAHAGEPQTAEEGTTVILDGSGSSDPDGRIVSYAWQQIHGASVTISDPAAVNPKFVAPPTEPGGTTLTFELTVTDNNGLRDTDQIHITITHKSADSSGQGAGSSSGCFIMSVKG
jgi:hypothetical protein